MTRISGILTNLIGYTVPSLEKCLHLPSHRNEIMLQYHCFEEAKTSTF